MSEYAQAHCMTRLCAVGHYAGRIDRRCYQATLAGRAGHWQRECGAGWFLHASRMEEGPG